MTNVDVTHKSTKLFCFFFTHLDLATNLGDAFVEMGMSVMLPCVPRITQRKTFVIVEQLRQGRFQKWTVIEVDSETISLND